MEDVTFLRPVVQGKKSNPETFEACRKNSIYPGPLKITCIDTGCLTMLNLFLIVIQGTFDTMRARYLRP